MNSDLFQALAAMGGGYAQGRVAKRQEKKEERRWQLGYDLQKQAADQSHQYQMDMLGLSRDELEAQKDNWKDQSRQRDREIDVLFKQLDETRAARRQAGRDSEQDRILKRKELRLTSSVTRKQIEKLGLDMKLAQSAETRAEAESAARVAGLDAETAAVGLRNRMLQIDLDYYPDKKDRDAAAEGYAVDAAGLQVSLLRAREPWFPRLAELEAQTAWGNARRAINEATEIGLGLPYVGPKAREALSALKDASARGWAEIELREREVGVSESRGVYDPYTRSYMSASGRMDATGGQQANPSVLLTAINRYGKVRHALKKPDRALVGDELAKAERAEDEAAENLAKALADYDPSLIFDPATGTIGGLSPTQFYDRLLTPPSGVAPGAVMPLLQSSRDAPPSAGVPAGAAAPDDVMGQLQSSRKGGLYPSPTTGPPSPMTGPGAAPPAKASDMAPPGAIFVGPDGTRWSVRARTAPSTYDILRSDLQRRRTITSKEFHQEGWQWLR